MQTAAELSDYEILIRTVAAYYSESAVGVMLLLIFLRYSRIYNRHFLKMWSYSWLAFVVNTLIIGSVTLYGVTQVTIARHVGSYISIVANMFQVFFLLLGCYEFINNNKRPHRQLIIYWSIGIFITGLAITLPYIASADMATARYLIRVGSRYLIITVGFIWAAYITGFSSTFSKGLGKNLIAFSFFIYGVYHVYYFTIVITNSFFIDLKFPFFFGIVELVLVGLIGISMVIWLLEDERERLLKTNLELDNFIYRTSHDLRSPIATMLGITSLAEYEIQDKLSLRYMGMIDGQLQKLDRVISDILHLVRGKKTELKFETIAFNKIIQTIISDLELTQGIRNINFEYPEQRENVLYTDYNHLKIVLMNVLNNAIKYHNFNHENPYVRISFTRVSGTVEISIEDNGQGISEGSLPHIFDMFYRANATIDGTGLGLYIVSEALSRVDGKISVKSTLGTGSTFKITLLNT